MEHQLTRTKEQLRELGNPQLIIQLRDGYTMRGYPDKFTRFYIYIKDKDGDIIDIPRRLIERSFLVIEGGKGSNGK